MSTPPLAKAYCVCAGVFFSACAYAQLNDPDPLFWACVYLGGGLGLNVLVLSYHNNSGFISNISFVYSMFIVGLIAWISSNLIPALHQRDTEEEEGKIMLNMNSMSSLIWSFLEEEEGREIAGLFILLLHVSQIPSFANAAKGANNVTTTSGIKVLPAAAAASICVGVYMWVYYQPQMNRRLNVEHCNGQLQFGN